MLSFSSGLRQLLLDDFHKLLGKASAKPRSGFPTVTTAPAAVPITFKKQTGTIFSAEADLDGGCGNPQKTRIPTAAGKLEIDTTFLLLPNCAGRSKDR